MALIWGGGKDSSHNYVLVILSRFTGMKDPNDYSYSYNPCVPFKGTYDCNTVHVSWQLTQCYLKLVLYNIVSIHPCILLWLYIIGLPNLKFWSYSKFWYCWSWHRGDVDRHWRNTLPLLYRTTAKVKPSTCMCAASWASLVINKFYYSISHAEWSKCFFIVMRMLKLQ